MSLVVNEIAKKSSGPRHVPKAGTVPARLLSVVDLGVQKRPPYQGEEKPPIRQVHITFELPNDKFEYNGEMVPARISPRTFNISADPKSKLYQFMQSIDPMNALKGDLSNYPDTACLLTVIHTKVMKDGQEVTYANVSGCMPAPEGFPVGALHDEPYTFDFDNPTIEGLRATPEFLRAKMREAVNYSGSKVEALMEQLAIEASTSNDDKPATTTKTKSAGVPEGAPY